MFERFTDRARRVVSLAQEEARLRGHFQIGPEHILLALVREGEGVAGQALTALGVSLSDLRATLNERTLQGDRKETLGHLEFSPLSKRVLEHSLREALHLGHNYIGTEHILLGLLGEDRCLACQVLTDKPFSLTLNEVRLKVIQLLTGYTPQEEAAKTSWSIFTSGGGAGASGWYRGDRVPNSVSAQLSDEDFATFQRQLRFEVEDLFTKEKHHYPLKWVGTRVVGIDWENGKSA